MTSAGAISRFGNRRSGLAHMRYSTELSSGGQPAGLAEGSRWSLRAKGERPPENRVGWSSTPAGCQNLEDMTAATTRPAVLTASTWGRIGLRAFPEAAGTEKR